MNNSVSGNNTEQQSAELAHLLLRIRKADAAALATLYEATINRVYTLALRILRNAADAEEISIDVYKQVWDQAARYDAARGPVLAWLMVITRSRALDRLRKTNQERGIRQHLDNPDTAYTEEQPTTVQDLLEIMEHNSRVHEALKQLSPAQRQAITLGFMEGLSHPEIATRLATPLGTVKSNIRRGLTRLRQLLSESGI